MNYLGYECCTVLSSYPPFHISFRNVHCIKNRPLPSSRNPYFQNEARCAAFLVKMSFICVRMKNDFHIKG